MVYDQRSKPTFIRYASNAGKGLVGLVVGASLLAYSLNNMPSNNLPRYLPNQATIAQSNPDYYGIQFVKRYKQDIVKYAKQYGVPPEMIVAALLSENYQRPKLEDIKDIIGTSIIGRLINLNPSVGPGQINVSTASGLYKELGIEGQSREQIEKALLDPSTNIMLIAKLESQLMNRKNRLPQSTQIDVLDDPHLIAIIGSEYSMGATQTNLGEAISTIEGQSFALAMAQTDFEQLGEEFKITHQQKRNIEDYLREIHK